MDKLSEFNERLHITCECGRKDCAFEWTDSGNMVIICKTCLTTVLLCRTREKTRTY